MERYGEIKRDERKDKKKGNQREKYTADVMGKCFLRQFQVYFRWMFVQ